MQGCIRRCAALLLLQACLSNKTHPLRFPSRPDAKIRGLPASSMHQTLCSNSSLSLTRAAAGEKGSAYAFRAPGGKMDMTGVVPVLDVKASCHFRDGRLGLKAASSLALAHGRRVCCRTLTEVPHDQCS